MDLSLTAQGIVLGVLTGAVYALMASGLTLIFGVMDIINIGQGALVILGAYLSYALSRYLHIDLFLGLLITMPLMFGLGVLIELVFIRPLKRDRTMFSILVTFGIAIVIEGLLGLIFSTDLVKLDAWYVTQSFSIFGFYIAYIYLFGFILSLLLLGGLYLLLYRTQFGASLRASMQNRVAAQLIGIDVERVSALTFGVGVALTAAGGMGSLGGALIASFAMLVVEDVTAALWSPTWSTTVFFILLVLVLLVRPQGLFGQLAGRKQ